MLQESIHRDFNSGANVCLYTVNLKEGSMKFLLQQTLLHVRLDI